MAVLCDTVPRKERRYRGRELLAVCCRQVAFEESETH